MTDGAAGGQASGGALAKHESTVAMQESTVKALYQDTAVSEKYIQDRFTWAWSRHLHRTQVAALNALIGEHRFASILEVAPGPARLTTDLVGVQSGVMVEASEAMLSVARDRLKQRGLSAIWDVRHGNAFELDALGRTFDFAYTFRFIRHFEERDRRRLYAQLAGRLNLRGLLVFDVVNRPTREAVDRKYGGAPKTELPVYDVTYLESEFRAEMAANGFEVLSMKPVLRCFLLQAALSYKLQSRIPALADGLVKALEYVPAKNPLEWIAVCRKIS